MVLIRERRYNHIKVADIIARADVGRSTFYDHFKSKDDILLHSMAGLYAVLAQVIAKDANIAQLTGLLEHFWQNRHMARDMMFEPASALGPKHGTRHLTELIESRLQTLCRERKIKPTVPLTVAAAQTAEGLMAALRVWLMGKVSCTPALLAKALHASASASVEAFVQAARR
ncbi:MAG: helix-turn-helix transcriptional regulator [Rhodospirillaceae bacterium]|nr:helix-turn-helix transcriptional regulator [Rhodospirillaceae bacterium]